MGSQAISLADLAAQAGAGDVILQYLEARGIKTTPTLALIAQDRDTFVTQIVRALLEGFRKGSIHLTVTEDERPIAQAVMEHMWSEAQLQWQERQASVLRSAAQPIAAAPSGTAPGSTVSSAPNDKIPKQLPAQVWQKQIARYNGITVDGRPRRFPEKEVLGAEQVLGRIWHEHTVSKIYTPVGLGELLQKRSFTAAGEVNPLQKQAKATQLLRVQDDQIVQDEDNKTWTPRSMLSLMDGVNAIRWAWVLLQLGEEDHVHTFADWFIQKIRARPTKLENMRIFWESAGWRIAMGMRAGQSFGDVTTSVMSDVDLLNEAMSRELPKETKPGAPRKRPAQDDHAPPPQRPRNSFWGQGSNSKGSKGNHKGKPGGYGQYGQTQRWRYGGWNRQSAPEGPSAHDAGLER